ncbi:hypothetical protein Trydic_g16323 [Trypoxylus dichotomus]
MKNKSVRHKEYNVFKFQPFSERISNLDINVFYRIGHEYETQSEDEISCCFYQAIEKWNVLNLTEGYGSFKKEVKPFENITLTQLLFNKDHVANVLLEHLKRRDALYLQPLLEILVAFVQDLHTDFYQYYPEFLNILIELLNTKDTEQLEWIFTCLAYIFKLLWRILIKKIDSVFNLLLPLLSDIRPEYINNFAAEGFAFVARKVKDKKSFLQMIIRTVQDTKDGISGSGRLLFEIVKGVNVTKEETVNMKNIMMIHRSLEKNFSSPYNKVRLYTTHIYSLFDTVLKQQDISTNEEWALFSICYKIECIQPQVHTYREQLIYFDKLNFERPQISLSKNTEFVTVPLRYLCGTLHMNFKLLWDPVIKIIASYANGLEMNTFWEIFVEELKTVVVKITQEENKVEVCSFGCDFLDELFSNAYKIENKPDFSNYRLLLWKAIRFFPEIAEAKTRDVSVLLLDFVENEYMKCSTENALTWNIKHDPTDTSNIVENNLEDTTKDEINEPPTKLKGKYVIKTLIQHLEVFAKIRSAKSMYREPELYKLYFELLSHKNSEVQKVALDCIMTYKFKYLIPYKEHLYNLVDDKNFKNELVAFRVDPESSMIQEEHRNEVIPIIMNIVFSKMVSKTGLRTGARISELVWEPEISDKLLQLLIPVVLKKCQNANEEEILQLMTALNNLLINVHEPETHLKQISPLFGEVTHISCRKILCQLLNVVAKKSHGHFVLIDEIITKINAWDSKWVNQPDFQIRTDTFKQVQSMILENSNTNSDARNECILLLGCLSRECADAHVVLRDLQKLSNSQDLEVDFFENLTHLQVHRHGRALLKFSAVYKEELTLPNIRTLTQFVLPLTTHYFCNEKYKDKHSLIDAANDALGTICKLLPWHQYEGLLKFYLSKLQRRIDFQKQLVKVIVTILDSFHFNLSKGQLQDKITKTSGDEVNDETRLCTGQIAEEDNVSNENVNSIDKEGDEIEAILDKLEKITEDTEENEEQNISMEKASSSIKAYEKVSVLCKSAATRVMQTIQIALLPQLHKILAEMTHYESNHKINRKRVSTEREEEDLLRIPISLALVKLLQKLPKRILDSNLSGILIKLCTFLKSQLESVRRVARETLQKIMTTLGPPYLGLLLDEMVPLLSRGFQVHVLVYTVHSVLVSLKDMFKPKDIDIILNTVIKLCNVDLFGILAEEKEVEKIISKVYEAKSTKSFDTYHILGQYITEKCMMDLVLPIKEILTSSHSFKTVNKAQECFRHIALGLIDNDFIPSGSLLKFSFGIASESIPELFALDKSTIAENERKKLERQKPDCFIIPKEPVYKSGHRTSNVKSSNKTNAHIMIEFGLKLCHLLLKRDKIREVEFKPFLDPFVPIFKKCLTSKDVKLNTITLQCLGWILKYELPSLKNNIAEIVKSMFEILHKYGAAGLSKGDNFDLVVSSFKAMTVLVRDVKYFTVDDEQLKTLLLYIEQDLYDHERQAIAFSLLKAILSRKLITPVLLQIMDKVAELSITSELPHVRLQSRNVSHQFLMDYPLGKRLDKHITFYLAQLKYEMQTGRESALEMIQVLINSFPIKILKEYSGTFLVTLGARLINDPEPSCKKMVADCINAMLNRLSYSDREPLFNIIKVWLSESNVLHRQLAAQLCGILVTVEKAAFEKRLSSLIPLIKSQFDLSSNNNQPGKFVRLRKEDDMNSEKLDKMKDHHLFQILQLLLKISAQCPAFLKQINDIEEITKFTQQLLAHPHDWVRLTAAQFLGFVLSSIDIIQLEELLLKNRSCSGYLHSDPFNDIKFLTLNLCDQLQPNCVKSNLAEQVVKNLVFIARVLQNIPTNDNKKINLLWLTRRMRKIVNSEIVENPTSTILRTEIFKWIAGVVTALDLDNLQPILHHLLAPLVREMVTTDESETEIRRLSKDVANIIKKKVGLEKYTENISKLEQQLSIKRLERKRYRNQLAVTDPEFATIEILYHSSCQDFSLFTISCNIRMGVCCIFMLFLICIHLMEAYDPNDTELDSVIPPKGTFEAFYLRGEETGSSRAAHSHGSFYKHRNPALVDAKNAAAYGYRFDGYRRFNYN